MYCSNVTVESFRVSWFITCWCWEIRVPIWVAWRAFWRSKLVRCMLDSQCRKVGFRINSDNYLIVGLELSTWSWCTYTPTLLLVVNIAVSCTLYYSICTLIFFIRWFGRKQSLKISTFFSLSFLFSICVASRETRN